MTVSNVNSTTAAAAATTSTTSAPTVTVSGDQIDNPNSALTKNDFLQMLITKLQYQDPLNPVTDDSFVADMAQFSSLEQMQNLNTSFTAQSTSMDNMNTNLVALIAMQNTTQAAGLIGKSVTLTTQSTTASDGTTTPGTTVSGQVSSIQFVNGQPQIMVSGHLYSIADVTQIQA
jgi:flagellar basal-body rod modification protein FlgD